MTPDERQQFVRELAAIAAEIDRRSQRAQAHAQLQALADFCDTHDPAAVAGAVLQIPEMLVRIARLDLWLRRYAQALRRRQPQ